GWFLLFTCLQSCGRELKCGFGRGAHWLSVISIFHRGCLYWLSLFQDKVSEFKSEG
ncbi:unnamed protein product, partial [Prunus brigantina]